MLAGYQWPADGPGGESWIMPSATEPSASDTAAEPAIPEGPDGRRRRLLVLLLCSSSLFMTYLDSTILNVALPTLQHDLHASVAGLQWVADAYLLMLASLLLFTGSMADRLGRRRLFSIGLVAFSAGSLLCSVAPNTGTLIAFRMIQALGGSMLTPVSLSIVRNTFTDARERARALGIWSGVFGLATACGPVVGGILVGLAGWRSVFWVNVPIGIAVVLATRRFVPESRAPAPRRVDVPGQLLMILILGTLTYAIIDGPSAGWGSPLVVALFVVAATAVVVFLLVERRRVEPLLELRFFRSPPFTGASVVAVLCFTVLAGFLFVNTLYLQEVHGDSPLTAGLALLPATAVMALSAPLAGRIMAQRGPRIPLVAGGVAIALGSAALLNLGPTTPAAQLAVAYVLLGFGIGVVNPPITNTAVTGMPPAQAGVASAVASTARQIGNVLGVAVMGAQLTAGLTARLATLGVPAAASASRLTTGAGIRHDPAVDRAFSLATHGPWLLAVGCGVAIAAVSLATTTRRARATARSISD